jgi:hypothetical protein
MCMMRLNRSNWPRSKLFLQGVHAYTGQGRKECELLLCSLLSDGMQLSVHTIVLGAEHSGC